MFLLFILFVIIAPQATAAVQCSEIKTSYRNACDCSVDSKFNGLDLMIFKPNDCRKNENKFECSSAAVQCSDIKTAYKNACDCSVDSTFTGLMIFKPNDCEEVETVLSPIKLKEFGSRPVYLTAVGNELYFRAIDDTNGWELWKSNGTEAGTVMVKDINSASSGETSSDPPSSYPSELTVVGDTLYFTANDTTNGIELWKSDGTKDGTVMVKDINPASSGETSSRPYYFTAVGNELYFTAYDGTNDWELWKSNGTEAGTDMVKDIHSDGSGSPYYLAVVGDTLYFSANDGTNGFELWKSDGTEAGTVMVKDIDPVGWGDPYYLTAVGNELYFTAYDGTNGWELWKSDGTEAGTVMVKDIHPSGSSVPRELTVVGDTLYFSANNGAAGTELWKSDGTEDDTVMVKDINTASSGDPSSDPPSSGDPYYLTAVGNTLYFSANDGTNGRELWKSDGTEAGTVMVKDINPASSNETSSYPRELTAVGNTLYFSANNGTNGWELWKSDGTEAGTVMVKDIHPSGSSDPRELTVVGDTLYFSANDGGAGELWAFKTVDEQEGKVICSVNE